VSRKYGMTRTNFKNAFCICSRCHREFHDFPREFSHFITDSQLAPYYDEVLQLARSGGKMDWMMEVERLKQLKEFGWDLKELRDMQG